MTNKTTLRPETFAQLVQVKDALNLAGDLGANEHACNDFFSDLLDSLGTDLEVFNDQF